MAVIVEQKSQGGSSSQSFIFPGASGNSNQKSMAAAATPGRSGAMLCQHYEWSERWCEEMEEEKASGIPTLFLDRD